MEQNYAQGSLWSKLCTPSERGLEKFTILQWEKYCVLARTGVLGSDFRRMLQVILETLGKSVFEKAKA